ncbi:hypothetical protein HZU77_004685 [Neisseriaceae bacterium TC5R-5]|nr:hypothetical protein [Neisseriaceae bacterium TC5R-5]
MSNKFQLQVSMTNIDQTSAKFQNIQNVAAGLDMPLKTICQNSSSIESVQIATPPIVPGNAASKFGSVLVEIDRRANFDGPKQIVTISDDIFQRSRPLSAGRANPSRMAKGNLIVGCAVKTTDLGVPVADAIAVDLMEEALPPTEVPVAAESPGSKEELAEQVLTAAALPADAADELVAASDTRQEGESALPASLSEPEPLPAAQLAEVAQSNVVVEPLLVEPEQDVALSPAIAESSPPSPVSEDSSETLPVFLRMDAKVITLDKVMDAEVAKDSKSAAEHAKATSKGESVPRKISKMSRIR